MLDLSSLPPLLARLVLTALIEALAPPPLRLVWELVSWLAGEAGGGA
jgi:hypothetical protein